MLQNTTALKNVSLSSLLRFEHLLFDGGEELGTDTTTALFTVVSFSVALSQPFLADVCLSLDEAVQREGQPHS